ncbi:MAG: DUF6159 family protein [Candidatus Hydrogenedentota bacterium]
MTDPTHLAAESAGPILRPQPLDMGDVLDHTLWVIQARAKPLFIVLVCTVLPANLLVGLAWLGMAFVPFMPGAEGGMTEEDMVLAFGLVSILALGITALAAAVVLPLAAAAVSYIVSTAYFGGDANPWRALRRAFGRLPVLVVSSLLYWIAAGIGFMLCIIPGFWLMIACFLYLPVIAFESRGPVQALRRSFRLTEGNRLRVFGLMLVLGVLSSGITMLSFLAPIPGLQQLLEALLGMITGAVFYVVYTVLYFSIRSQRENMDVEALIDRVSARVQQGGGEEVVL